MTARTLLCLCCLLCACSEGLEPSPGTSESRHALEGYWHLEATQTDNTCPELDLFGAVDVVSVSIVRDHRDRWILEGAGTAMTFDEVEPGQWLGRLSVPYEGCTLEAETVWDFEGAGPTSFAAWRTTTFRVQGADCGTPREACSVTHAVRGVR